MAENNNKRIAKNTLIIYIQLFFSIIINLVISRLILQILGASDYGIFCVVGGVIGMFTVLSSSLSTTTIRFLNFEMGKKDGNLNFVFNQSHLLHIIFALIIFFLLEIFGSIYVLNFMNLPEGRLFDTMFVFQISTIVACIGVVNVPFQAIFVVFEKFNIIALVELTSLLLLLILIFVLNFYPEKALCLYSIMVGIKTIIPFICYHVIGRKKWYEIVKWKRVKNWSLYREQLIFNNWNFIGTINLVIRSQGSTLLINWFFGTVVNAAYGISEMVFNQINGLVGRFDNAVTPQITQSVGAGQFDKAIHLSSITNRGCLLIMEVTLVSLFVELNWILSLWLGDDIPTGTYSFCLCVLVAAFISSSVTGIGRLIDATGNIKWFKIQSLIWQILAFGIGIVAFLYGLPAYSLIILCAISDLFNRVGQFFLLNKYYNFPVYKYLKKSYIRPIAVLSILIIWSFFYKYINTFIGVHNLIGILVTFLFSMLIVFFIGLDQRERIKSFEFIKRVKYGKIRI